MKAFPLMLTDRLPGYFHAEYAFPSVLSLRFNDASTCDQFCFERVILNLSDASDDKSDVKLFGPSIIL